MKFNKRFYKNQKSGKGKSPNEQSSNEKRKGSSKGKKIESFNCGGLGHYAQDCPSPKDAKKSMQATWSDTKSEESAFTTSENANGYSRHMTGDATYFTSLENYNGGVVTFGDGNLACVKGKGSIVILGYPKLDEVLYVEGLKANLLSISQMYDKEHKVNFHQDFCEIVNKEGKVIIIGHRTVDNCYAINPNFRTPLMCNRAKLDLTKL
ncbi:hypothetical protein AAG906_002220 [Vitis piasezkii]